MPEKKICAIIPAYNESETIASVISGVRKYIDHVIVYDDGSRDGTAEIARKNGADLLCSAQNHGKGYALRASFEHARKCGYHFALTIDGDGQHQPEDIAKMLMNMKKAPILLGARLKDRRKMPILMRAANYLISLKIKTLSGEWICDSQTGMRLIDLEKTKEIRTESMHYEEETEFLLRAIEANIRIVEVPIKVHYNTRKIRTTITRDLLLFIKMFRRISKCKKARRPHEKDN